MQHSHLIFGPLLQRKDLGADATARSRCRDQASFSAHSCRRRILEAGAGGAAKWKRPALFRLTVIRAFEFLVSTRWRACVAAT